MDSLDEFFLPLTAFDVSINSKNGCGVGVKKLVCVNLNCSQVFEFISCFQSFPVFKPCCPAVWPSNLQYQNHFYEFLYYGYKSGISAVEVRFPARDGTRKLEDGSVGISDGLTKILIMEGIVAFLEELEISQEDLASDTTLTSTLKSFVAVRCTYTEFRNPSHHYLHSLRSLTLFCSVFSCTPSRNFFFAVWCCLKVLLYFLTQLNQEMGYVTAEKVEPSPITIMADMNQAIKLERVLCRGGRTGTRDLLNKVVSEYNRMVTKKSHRIDSARKALIYNLPLNWLSTWSFSFPGHL